MHHGVIGIRVSHRDPCMKRKAIWYGIKARMTFSGWVKVKQKGLNLNDNPYRGGGAGGTHNPDLSTTEKQSLFWVRDHKICHNRQTGRRPARKEIRAVLTWTLSATDSSQAPSGFQLVNQSSASTNQSWFLIASFDNKLLYSLWPRQQDKGLMAFQYLFSVYSFIPV